MGDFVGGGISEYESRVPWVRHRGDEGGREGDGTQRCIHRQGRGGEAKPDPGPVPLQTRDTREPPAMGEQWEEKKPAATREGDGTTHRAG
jgi:hypothetical protein